MSLEAALAANTTAINSLVDVWGKLASMGKVIERNVESGEQTNTTAGNLEIPLAKAEAKKSIPAPVEAAPVAQTAEIATATEITYADVSKAVLAKMKDDKAAVMAAAVKFGVKNAKELKPEQWADFIKEIA